MSNYGSGINHQLGLDESFTAHSVDEYIKKAIALYNDPEKLIDLRNTLRSTVERQMCRPNHKNFERWMRAIWRHHCKNGGEAGAEWKANGALS